MFVRDATRQDLEYVANRMSDLDVDRHRGMSNDTDREDVVSSWIERYSRIPGMMVFGLDEPIAIVGTMTLRRGVCTLVMICTPRLSEIFLPLTRFLRKLFKGMEEAGIHRFESTILESQEEIRKWLPMLGLDHEATHRGYGTRGETYVQYARVSDKVAPRG